MTRAADDKVLVLLRHAKAEQDPGKADHERELTPRGWRDAQAAGAWLHQQGLGAELVLCSPTTRTRQTWEAAMEGGACGEQVEFPRGIHVGGPAAVLQEVRDLGGDAQVVLVIGHNPTMAMLASLLADGDGSRDAHEVLASGFPTATAAVLRYCGPWHDLGPAAATLERCHVARAEQPGARESAARGGGHAAYRHARVARPASQPVDARPRLQP